MTTLVARLKFHHLSHSYVAMHFCVSCNVGSSQQQSARTWGDANSAALARQYKQLTNFLLTVLFKSQRVTTTYQIFSQPPL